VTAVRVSRQRLGAALLVVGGAGVLLLGSQLATTPALITAVSLLPAAVFTGLALLLDRRARAPRGALAAAFLWGASVAAFVAIRANDAVVGTVGGGALAASLLGPLIEEVAKASALLVVLGVWRGEPEDARDGMVYGGLAGLGFAATENLGYFTLAAVQGGGPGLARALYLRGLLQGLNHAAFTATTGAAVGFARGHARGWARAAVVLAGLGLAVGVHALWNGVASTAITQVLCNAEAGGTACAADPATVDLLVTVPVLVASFIGPVFLLLLAVGLDARVRRARPS
jgi:RsiW-degrading membrane proteinase PrsW (M82 family)